MSTLLKASLLLLKLNKYPFNSGIYCKAALLLNKMQCRFRINLPVY